MVHWSRCLDAGVTVSIPLRWLYFFCFGAMGIERSTECPPYIKFEKILIEITLQSIHWFLGAFFCSEISLHWHTHRGKIQPAPSVKQHPCILECLPTNGSFFFSLHWVLEFHDFHQKFVVGRTGPSSETRLASDEGPIGWATVHNLAFFPQVHQVDNMLARDLTFSFGEVP